MRLSQQNARRAATIMGKANAPDLEDAIAYATQEHSIWWFIWSLLTTDLRLIWLGIVDGLKHPESYR